MPLSPCLPAVAAWTWAQRALMPRRSCGQSTAIPGRSRRIRGISGTTSSKRTSRLRPYRRFPATASAGPPCQDYSTLWNHDGLKTARGNLFREVARFLDALRPAGFVLENVPGLLSANRGAAWTLVRHALRSPSSFAPADRRAGSTPVRYDLTAQVVDLADLGVPQHRDRLIVVGSVAISALGRLRFRSPLQEVPGP
jgi:site-specific DNA-cytosine methylase